MKKIVLIIEAILVISVIFPNISYAEKESEQTTISTQDILSSQQDSLNISSFLKEAKKYTSSVYEDIDFNELFTSALTGKIDNEKIIKVLLAYLVKKLSVRLLY